MYPVLLSSVSLSSNFQGKQKNDSRYFFPVYRLSYQLFLVSFCFSVNRFRHDKRSRTPTIEVIPRSQYSNFYQINKPKHTPVSFILRKLMKPKILPSEKIRYIETSIIQFSTERHLTYFCQYYF